MTLSNSGLRQFARGLALAGVAGIGYVFGITSDRLSAQPTQPAKLPMTVLPQPVARPQPQPATQPQPAADRRTVAYIYGGVSVTREELGDFLIARGGYEKLELLVNKKIIEVEAARRNITVTPIEVRAGLEEDVRGLRIKKEDFVKHILPRYGKTLYEWTEDVIKPRLLLTKMCQDRVKVTEEDLKKAFENRYGERRQAKIICWSAEDFRAAQSQWAEASKGDVEFDSIARTQADKTLAAACGLVKPVGRHSDNPDSPVEKTLFNLKVGELSQIFKVEAGFMCIKCVAIIPPDPNAKLDDVMKKALYKEVYEKRLPQEIAKFFNELKTVAKPNIFLKGPPTAAEFEEGVKNIVNQVGAPTPPLPAPAPKP
ncbi:MAG: peptidylprolyl isomerase [Planctomycetia bacterium]|nr:peptidylprolyl isomerase [Planctomycetia bacterium]